MTKPKVKRISKHVMEVITSTSLVEISISTITTKPNPNTAAKLENIIDGVLKSSMTTNATSSTIIPDTTANILLGSPCPHPETSVSSMEDSEDRSPRASPYSMATLFGLLGDIFINQREEVLNICEVVTDPILRAQAILPIPEIGLIASKAMGGQAASFVNKGMEKKALDLPRTLLPREVGPNLILSPLLPRDVGQELPIAPWGAGPCMAPMPTMDPLLPKDAGTMRDAEPSLPKMALLLPREAGLKPSDIGPHLPTLPRVDGTCRSYVPTIAPLLLKGTGTNLSGATEPSEPKMAPFLPSNIGPNLPTLPRVAGLSMAPLPTLSSRTPLLPSMVGLNLVPRMLGLFCR